MVHVAFTSAQGDVQTVDVKDGATLLEAARKGGVSGVVGECGGFCNCATCHVYVDDRWCARLPAVEEHEDAMLDGTVSERLPTSRLACQIVLTGELDGLVVTLPEFQSI
jgi:2Fe-2S ferredoxin